MRYSKINKKHQRLIDENNELKNEIYSLKEQKSKIYGILDSLMHEMRRLNLEIVSASEDLSKSIANKNYSLSKGLSDDIFYTSGLISSRLGFSDLELNPELISRQETYSVGIYQKFDKSRRVLSKSSKKKDVTVKLEGPSRNKIQLLPIFEMLPFVLLDNAIKYSPKNQDINISILDNPSTSTRVQVILSSIGPMVSEEEAKELTKKGFRSKRIKQTSGQGLGLYLANTIVGLSKGVMEITSSQTPCYEYAGIPYSAFTVTLSFGH